MYILYIYYIESTSSNHQNDRTVIHSPNSGLIFYPFGVAEDGGIPPLRSSVGT